MPGPAEPSRCLLCRTPLVPHWTTRDSRGLARNYLRCPACELVRLSPGSPPEDLAEAGYAADYYGGGYSKFSGAVQALREWSARRRAREVAGFFDRPGRVLDVGCGEGLFLEAMQHLGWEVAGCELGPPAAARARRRLGRPVHEGPFETMPRPERPWDVVMVWHVLEHVEDPVAVLSRLVDDLSPDGLLVIGIPNAESWQARLAGADWFHLDPPRHLFHFGRRHLEGMLDAAGAPAVEWRHFSLEYNPYGWAQSLLNRLGFRRDAMYERLRSGADRRFAGGALRVLAWTLLGPSVVPAVAEAAAGAGGTVVAYARRRRPATP